MYFYIYFFAPGIYCFAQSINFKTRPNFSTETEDLTPEEIGQELGGN